MRAQALALRVLGPLTVSRGGAAIPLPPSRKVRALLGFLALTPGPVGRSRLCDLLWDVPNDPRGELRWCLSKLRGVLGARHQHRLVTTAPDLVALDMTGCFVDATAIDEAVKAGAPRATTDALAELCALFGGDLLDGLQVDASPEFDGWLVAQRQRYRTLHASVLEELVKRSPAGHQETFARLDRWLQLAPFDPRPHAAMLEAFVQSGRRRDAEDHLAATARTFASQGVDERPLREAWRAIRDRTTRPREAAVAQAPESSLVGRDREWVALSHVWKTARQGKASFVLVTGEAGIGKTRLAEELLGLATRHGASVAHASCYVAERPMAYTAVADWLRASLFRPVLDGLPAAQLSQLARVLPGILMDHPGVPAPPPFTESWQRGHFFEALARAVLSAPQPMLAFIDDVQWCDPETIEWLHYLLRLDQSARLFVVATARTGDIDTDHTVAAMLRDLRRSGRGGEIALGPLSATDTLSLATRVAESGLPDASTLYERTRGNPLFIVELARAGLGDSEALPPKVHAVIRTRFSQLGGPARELASVAAVIGRKFTSGLLARVNGGDEDATARAMDELWQRRLIQPHGPGSYDFSHGLLRDVCYGELGPERRRLLHRRVANALGAHHAAEPDAVSSQIAEHFERGGQLAEAVPHLERAAEVVRHRYAEEEAIGFLERALGLLEHVPPASDRDRTELRLLASLGQALMATRGYGAEEVGRALGRARALCDQDEANPLRFAVLSGSWIHLVVRGELEAARSIAATCIEMGQRSGDDAIVAGGRFALGSSEFHLGHIDEAEALFQAVATWIDGAPKPAPPFEFGAELGVFCRAYIGHTRWLLGAHEEAAKVSLGAIARAQALSHPFSIAVALAYDAMLQQFRGDPERTEEQAEAAADLCRKHRFSYYLSWMPILRGWAQARSGALALGVTGMREGYAALRATGARLRAPYYLALMAETALRAGDADEALLRAAEGREIAQRTGERWRDAELTRIFEAASASARAGDATEARG